MSSQAPNDDKNQSQKILKQVEEQRSLFERNQSETSGQDADANDPAVIWGKRVGKILGFCFLIYLILSILGQLNS